MNIRPLHKPSRSSTPWRTLEPFTLALGLILAGMSTAQAAGFNVNSLVTFTPLSSTYRTVTDTSGCPSGFGGKFTFTARLSNKATSPAMPGLTALVQTLSNGNVLLDPRSNTSLGGAGASMTIPPVGQYADGLLSASEVVDVPFVICLKTRQSFQFFVDVFGIVTKLVSINRAGTDSANHQSGGVGEPVLSADGRFVAFTSFASDLVATDTNGTLDAFVRDLQTGVTTLVSINRAGTDSGNGDSGVTALSADGRFVVFTSFASDLVATDTNGTGDVFVRDLKLGTTTLVSVNRAGTDSGKTQSSSGRAALSADGRFVTFYSAAGDLVATDTNGEYDVFVRDLKMGTTTLVSVNRAGTGSGNSSSGFQGAPLLSADGRFVVFDSAASDLVANDTNSGQPGGDDDVFVRDLQAGTTTLVSVNRAGTGSGSGGFSSRSAISPDGRFVAFRSAASDLVANDTNGGDDDVFVRDLQAGTTTLVSVNRAGTASGNGASFGGALSADGRFVLFVSDANDLVATDTNGSVDVFVRDLKKGTTTLVSVNRAGTDSGNTQSFAGPASLSADGRFVTFTSDASDLVANDTNGTVDTFVRDLQTGVTTLVSVNRTGTDSGNHDSRTSGLSADGRFVAFVSAASDLVATDTNGGHLDPQLAGIDVFVRPVP